MRSRPSVAFLLLGWLVSLAVPAFLLSLGMVALDALFWLILGTGAAVATVFAAANRRGVARYAVLVPGLLGSASVFYADAVEASGPTAMLYYAALGLWAIAGAAAVMTANQKTDE